MWLFSLSSRRIAIIVFFLSVSTFSFSQNSVSIGTTSTNPKAVLWLSGTNQGIIIPIVSNKTNVSAGPTEKGMVVFDDSDKKVYFFDGTAWNQVGGSGAAGSQGIAINGNTVQLNSTAGATFGLSNTAPTGKGQLLVWDGSKWDATIAPTTTGQTLSWDNTNGRWTLANASLTLAGDVSGPSNNTTIASTSGNNIVAALNNGATTSKILPAQISAGTPNQVLTTSAGNVAVWANLPTASGTVNNIATGTGLTGGPITTTGTIALANTSVVPGSYGSATQIPQITVDAQGRITSASNVTPPLAGIAATGFLSAADWNTFNNKLSTETDPTVKAINGIVKSNGTTISAATAGTDYQAPLVSGTNIKTINGASVLGAGNITAVTTETDPTVTAINGLVKSNGTIISAATAGTDYLAPNGNGSALTNLNASNLATGTVPTARIDVGTTANKIVQLDATGKLPAIDGSQLINLPAGTETDPTVKAINGLVRSDGTTIGAAVSGTDVKTINGTSILGAGNITTLTTVTSADITDGTIVDADINTTANINGTKINPNFGPQAVSTTSTLTTGSSGQFVINASGNITKINNVTTSFPAAQGLANSVLTNDGSGNLSWTPNNNWGLTGNAGTNGATNFIGTTDAQPLVLRSNNTEGIRIGTDGGVSISEDVLSNRKIVFYDITGNTNQIIGFGLNPAVLRYQVDQTTTDHVFYAGTSPTTSNELFRIQGNGNVGVGNPSPTAKLDIAGNIKIADGTQGLGKVLTSDANGLASWQAVAGTGTVTSVSAGTGLTGGPITSSGSLAVDVGTTANKIVQLDGTGKLPAVDGSQLTNLPAGTETDPTVKAINGIVKSNGTTISAATAGTDYQAPLVSGTNIKTINGTSVLGAGNITAVATETDPTVTAINGLVKSNGTTISAATAGTDYLAPNGNGSALTNLNASNLASGTVPTARIDVGTTANKIVQLDATGKLPAVDGSQLTNLPTAAETDPTVQAINGLVKSNGTTITAATPGTDYVATETDPTVKAINGLVKSNGTTISAAVPGTDYLTTNQNITLSGDITGSGTTAIATTVSKINGSTWPANASGSLTNDGSGNLTWVPSGGSGTVTSITRGAGLVTGPAITTSGTIDVNVGTGPNQIVQLDGTGKLPALDGSQLTNLPAGTETDPTVTAINGLVKSNGTTISAATAGTDYLAPNGNGSALTNLNANNISSGTLAITNGGTGATTAPAARTALGLGTLSTLSAVTSSEITDGTIVDADINGTANINGAKINPSFGAQAVSTTSTLTTGTAGQFVVDATGNITKINNITTSFPATQGAANSVLTNDGAGNLTWAAGSGWALTGNTLAGGEKIGSTNGNPIPFITNNVERMRIDPSGNVGIGTTSPTQPLHVEGPEGQFLVTPNLSGPGATSLMAQLLNTTSKGPQMRFAGAVGGASFNDIGQDATGNFVIEASDVPLLTLNQNGALGVGSTPSFGTSGFVLTSNGAGGAPTWQAISGTGTVTSVAAGTGLTGGPITTSGTLAVDVGTTANKIVQLDGTGKLPAVDGSQLTNLPAGTETDPTVKAINGLVKSNGTTISAATAGTDYQAPLVSGTNIKTINGTSVLGAGNITAVATETDPTVTAINGLVKSNGTTISAATAGTDYLAPNGNGSALTNLNASNLATGTVPTARIDVGTTANKIVQLDATGKLPAVDGSQLTNLPAGTETDPTVSAINGIVKSDGTIISAATAGTDYLAPNGNGSALTNLNATNISSGTLAIANGGTGATTASAARTALGLGTLSTLSAVTSSEITDGTIVDADINGTANINGAKINPSFGAQAVSTTSTLTTGSTGQFVVDATGNITKINNITTSFPASQGAANTVLTNDGAGNLSWAASSGWGLSGNATTVGNKLGTTNGNALTFITSNTDRMTIDATGNIGIGTASPTALLTISGATSMIDVTNTGGGQNWRIVSDTDGTLKFVKTSGSTFPPLTLNGNGAIGIYDGVSAVTFGTTGQVLTSAGPGLPPTWSPGSTTTASNGITKTGNDFALGGVLTAETQINRAGSNFIIYGAGDFSVRPGGAGTERLFVDGATGNVGIGTIGPSQALSVSGGIIVDHAGSNNGVFVQSQVLQFGTGSGEGIGSSRQPGQETLDFYTGAAKQMTIKKTGNIGIGTDTPLTPLQIGGSLGFVNAGGDDIMAHGIYFDGSNFINRGANANSAILLGDGKAGIYTFPAGAAAGVASSPDMRFNVRPTGVGIQVDNPIETFQVNGATYLNPITAPSTTTDRLYNVGGDLFWNGTNISSGGSGWSLTGNAGTVDGTNFIGTTDDVPVNFLMNGQKAGRIERSIGGLAANTFYGYQSGNVNTTGWFNTGIGYQALSNNTTGTNNTAQGWSSLLSNTTGGDNTAFGSGALVGNTTGSFNTVVGSSSFTDNTIGNNNTATGWGTLSSNTIGNGNTASGYSSMFNSTTGANNTAYGNNSLLTNTTGNNNTVVGSGADVASDNLNNASALGAGATVTASNTIQLGNSSVTTVNVGTGTNAKLVAGQLQITGGTLGAGRVLTSDASGNATWQNAGSGWGLTGNAGTNPTTNFIGTTDNVALRFKTNNVNSGLIDPLTSNAFFGYRAGEVATGGQNVAMGANSLLANTSGTGNVAIGTGALQTNASGTGNIAIGNFADVSSPGLINSIAIGRNAIVGASNSMVLGGTGGDAVNVGIGTAQPVSDLQITTATHLFDFPSGSGFAHNVRESGGNLLHTTAGGASVLGLEPSKAGLYVNSTAAANATFGSSLANRMVLTETGLSVNKDAADNSAVLHVVSETTAGGGTPRGFMMPAVTTADRDAIPAPLTGLMIFNQTTNAFNFYNGTNWAPISGASLNAGLGLTLNGSNLDLGATNMPTATTFQGAGDNMLEIQSSNSALGTKAGIHFKMFQSAINTQYEIFTRKMDAIPNSGNSDLVMTKVFSTAGGYLDAFTIDNGTNNVIINNDKTTASNYGNFIVRNGNTGIGTTTPATKLHVSGTTSVASRAAGTLLDVNTTLTDNNSYMRFSQDGSNLQNPVFVGVDFDNGISEFWNQDGMDMRFGTNNAERLRITQAGNVGIGTATPGALLDVVGATNGIRVNSWLSAGSSVCGIGYVGTNLYRNASDNVWKFTNTNGTIGGTAINFADCSGTPNQISFVRALGPSTANANATVVESMRIDQNGRVGIGTSSPGVPLDIATATNAIFLSGGPNVFFNSLQGLDLSTGLNPTPDISVRASGAFLSVGSGTSGGFYVTSDERIKRKVGISDSRNDLATLMKLKITDYKYTDSLTSGNTQVKGVFAQQVETVYPQAISRQTGFIPNIYALADRLVFDDAKQTLQVTMTKPHGLVKGDKVKLISSTSGEKQTSITEADVNSFTVANWTEKSEKVFVYGKEVDDFRIVDYDRLFTLNISATQELVKLVEEQKKVIDELKAREEENKKKIAQLETSLNKAATSENELASLKSEIEKIKAALGLSVDAALPKKEEKK